MESEPLPVNLPNENSEALQEIDQQHSLMECGALQALLLGLCHTMEQAATKSAAYADLAEDELEMHDGDTAALQKARAEWTSRLPVLQGLLASLPPLADAERLNLSVLLQGALERCQRNASQKCQVQLPEDIYVRGNAFQLQTLVLELLRHFLQATAPEFHLTLRQRKLSRSESAVLCRAWRQLGEDAAAEIVEVAFARKAGDAPAMADLLPLDDLPAAQAPDMVTQLERLRWQGAALSSGAQLFCRANADDEALHLLFPLVNDWQTGNREMESYRSDQGGRARTILLVDDEDMIWDVVMDMLQDLGYQVLLAGDGQEAIDIYSENPGKIDLVILDMLMPRMDGHEAFQLLRKIDPKARVLISSGYVSNEAIHDVMQAGAAGFLRKPYRLADLAKKIREILENA